MITTSDFVHRLEALVLGGVGPGLPRREQDRHILLKAVTLGFRDELPCSERDLGFALQRWLDLVGRRVEIDPVSLRRALIDYGYLRRDPAGRTYEWGHLRSGTFTPEVEMLVPLDLIASARERRLERARSRPDHD